MLAVQRWVAQWLGWRVCCLLPAASLPAACRLPPAACRLPPATCRLPPGALSSSTHTHTLTMALYSSSVSREALTTSSPTCSTGQHSTPRSTARDEPSRAEQVGVRGRPMELTGDLLAACGAAQHCTACCVVPLRLAGTRRPAHRLWVKVGVVGALAAVPLLLVQPLNLLLALLHDLLHGASLTTCELRAAPAPAVVAAGAADSEWRQGGGGAMPHGRPGVDPARRATQRET